MVPKIVPVIYIYYVLFFIIIHTVCIDCFVKLIYTRTVVLVSSIKIDQASGISFNELDWNMMDWNELGWNELDWSMEYVV